MQTGFTTLIDGNMATRIPDEPLGPKVIFRTWESLHRRLKRFCFDRETTIQAVCNEAIPRYMDAVERSEARHK